MELFPFRALRPPKSRVEDVASPPYDVINTTEALGLAQGKPDSFLHVIRPEINFEDPNSATGQSLHDEAGRQLKALASRGALEQDEEPALWVYRLIMDGRAQVGMVGCADVDAYADGRIKKHEFTRPDKEDDRTQHVDTVGAHTGPVFLACRSTEGLQTLQEELMGSEPEYDFEADDGIRHTLWRVGDAEDLRKASTEYAAIDAFYIADGHHRAASAHRVRDLRVQRGAAEDQREFARFLVVVFPEDQLKILAYNRVVKDLNGLTNEQFLASLDRHFEVGPPGAEPSPPRARSLCVYLGGDWRLLRTRSHVVDEDDPVGRLDAALLQNLVLAPILGIENPRINQRIQFVGGIRGTDYLEKLAGEKGVAFSMFPTSIDELFAVADSGEVMPPKSTWFEPKLRSGLLVHPF